MVCSIFCVFNHNKPATRTILMRMSPHDCVTVILHNATRHQAFDDAVEETQTDDEGSMDGNP